MSMRMDMGTGYAAGGQAMFCGQCDSQRVTAACGEVREERAIKNPARWPGF